MKKLVYYTYLPGIFGAFLLIGGAGATGACSKDGSSPPPTGLTARFTLPSDGSLPLFLDIPFPSDVYLVNGQYPDPIPGFENIVHSSAEFLSHELAKQSGYSRIAMAQFYIDDPTAPLDDNGDVSSADIDPASLPASEAACVADTSSVFLIDLDAQNPANYRVACMSQFHAQTGLSKIHPSLGIGPGRGIVLAESHHYAAVMTSRVKDRTGRSVGAVASFTQATSGAGTFGALYGAAFKTVTTALSSALATDGAQIVALAPYTTQKNTDVMYTLRDSFETTTPPALAWDAATVAPMVPARFSQNVSGALPAGFTASLDDWLGVVPAADKLADGTDDPDDSLKARAHDQIQAVGTAMFVGQSFLQAKPNGYQDLDDATFASPPVSAPEKIWVSFAIPTVAMPAGGYPAVIFQHGLGGSRADFLEIANTFTKNGWIAAAIDSITFGARAPETQYQVDAVSNFGGTYKGPDGFGDPYKGETNGPFDLFGGLQNLGSLRDQFRQAELDTAQLVAVLRSAPDLSPLATNGVTPMIDASKIAYVGDSLGGIEGAAAAAIEPNVKAWVLNVTGGGILPEIGAHGPEIAIQLSAAGALDFGFAGDTFDESHPFIGIGQTIVEAGDPIAYASNLVTTPAPLDGNATGARNVFQIECIYDELVSNEADEALARAAGFGLASPNVGSNAGVFDLKNVAATPSLIPFMSIAPDATGIHDTPIPGITAVLTQVSPCAHSDDMLGSIGARHYKVPYNVADPTDGSEIAFQMLDAPYNVKTSYRQLQAAIVTYISGAFAGKGAPVITGLVAPIRDADGDGVTDDQDADPNNPSVH